MEFDACKPETNLIYANSFVFSNRSFIFPLDMSFILRKLMLCGKNLMLIYT